MKAKLQTFRGGYLGDVPPQAPKDQGKPLPLHDLQASAVEKETNAQDSNQVQDYAQIKVLQEWAEEHGVLLPTEYNANIEKVEGGHVEEDQEVDITERQYLGDNDTPLYLPTVSPCDGCDD
jgi:hypothetical protein